MIISGKQVNKKCYGRGVNYRLWRHRSARLSGENTIFANFAALSARRLRRHLQVCRECELRSLLARAISGCEQICSRRPFGICAALAAQTSTADFSLRH